MNTRLAIATILFVACLSSLASGALGPNQTFFNGDYSYLPTSMHNVIITLLNIFSKAPTTIYDDGNGKITFYATLDSTGSYPVSFTFTSTENTAANVGLYANWQNNVIIFYTFFKSYFSLPL